MNAAIRSALTGLLFVKFYQHFYPDDLPQLLERMAVKPIDRQGPRPVDEALMARIAARRARRAEAANA